MSITLVGTPQIGSANNGLDVTLNFDGSPAGDDIAFVTGGHPNDDTIGPTDESYTHVISNLGSDPRFGLWYKQNPGSSVVCKGGGNGQSGVAYASYVLHGVDLANPIDVTSVPAGPTLHSAVNNPDCAAITPVTDESWILALFGSTHGFSAGTISGYDNNQTISATDTVRMTIGTATFEKLTAVTEDPPAWSGGGTVSLPWYAITASLRAATSFITPGLPFFATLRS